MVEFLTVNDLTDIFKLFASGVGIGIMLATLFYILGSVIGFLFGIIKRS